MSIVKFSRVISCNSEDPKYPASNLLESQVGKIWRCKTPGEKQLVVILQMERSCRISSIDIGNENSAFIEIFVGRSAVPDQFEILRVTSLLMSTVEAKKGENKNAVRFFKEDEFSKPAVDEFWDRLKITCSQPFNKITPFGLSFIKVRTKDPQNDATTLPDAPTQMNSPNTSSPSQNSVLGKFKLKQETKNSSQVPIGSFFARRNEIKEDSPSTAAVAIRGASSNSEPTLKRLSDLLPGAKGAKKARQDSGEAPSLQADGRRSATGRVLYEDTHSDDEAESNTPLRISRNEKPSKDTTDVGPLVFKALPQSDEKIENKSPKMSRNLPNKNTQVVSKEKENNKASANTPDSRAKKPPAQKVSNVPQKPFNRLLEDVVFVISGYQNPYRSDLRSKALSMGAKYKGDWDSSCTHLICAFPNTPKANTVRGKGWIIRKDWIEDCYSQRKRLLSKNYRIDKTDTSVYGNEEEIHEEIPNPTTTTPKRTNNRRPSPKEASTEEKNEPKRKKDTKEDDHETDPENNIYEVETDVDSGGDDDVDTRLPRDYESIDLEILPDFLSKIKIYLGSDLQENISDNLKRYITAFKGEVVSDIDDSNYIISEDNRYKENVANLPVLSPDWLWECTDQRQLVSIQDYSL